jgi:N,N-dimethylformamidase
VGPQGSRFAPEPIDAPCNATYRGEVQRTHVGSLALVDEQPALLELSRGFTLAVHVYPTTPVGRRQALCGIWDDGAKRGLGLEIGEGGELRLLLGDGDVFVVSTGEAMSRRWYFVAAMYDGQKGWATLICEPLASHDVHGERRSRVTVEAVPRIMIPKAPLTFAAWCAAGTETDKTSGPFIHYFNGRLERPRLAAGPVSEAELESFSTNPLAATAHQGWMAAWDFSRDIDGDQISDLGPHGLHGRTVNQPTRAVPGHNWDPDGPGWRQSPQTYGAIHFHEDDLFDVKWQPSFALTIPPDWESGVYAVRLDSEAQEFWIPFIVRPPPGEARCSLALLFPTATYTAYQNHRSRFQSLAGENLHGRLIVLDATDVALLGSKDAGLSAYDSHSDSSGVVYASPLRPAFNIRPTGKLWNFAVDLLLVDWLSRAGVAFDAFTDEDLHCEGVELLTPYRAVLTGSHPEYVSTPMLNALQEYLGVGGRIFYAGGNGFYWRIAFHSTQRGAIEIRRPEGVRAWTAEPGAHYLSYTGERGGLWRANGRAPQNLVGVGFIGQGFDKSTYYRRTEASRDPRADWVFEGIDDEVLGDFGLLQGGAAGIEIDATDARLGTPAHALVLARSECHSNNYRLAGEEVPVPHGATGGLLCEAIRAEMVFFETPSGGAVFSTGSIAFAGALPCNNFDNHIYRLATNVLRRFLAPEPFTFPTTPGGPER